MSSIKIFNTVDEMRAATDLAVGDICETLGYYAAGDGGGAKYTVETKADTDTVDNGTTTILFTNESSVNFVARFIDEGKPVNVLQFGARNYYVTNGLSTNDGPYPDRPDSERDDSVAIQAAIEYTLDNLFKKKNDCNAYQINTVIVPEGNYIIRNQINMPPYMQMQLDGDVQFKAYVNSGEEKLYRFKKYKTEGSSTETVEFEEIRDREETYENGNTVTVTKEEQIVNEKEVFAKNEFESVCVTDPSNTVNLKTDGELAEGYYVYKKGIIKICERFDKNGYLHNPYTDGSGTIERYAVLPHVNNQVFCGKGSLTILNKTFTEIVDDNGKKKRKYPCYICGVEIGSSEDYFRMNNVTPNSVKFVVDKKPIYFNYEMLRFSNLKITECYVGILSHAHSCYMNTFSNNEFFQNVIGFQYGVYGKLEKFEEFNSSIILEKPIDGGEMNHFRDCVFTGNRISVNIMLSSFSATFTSCHFDFENCIFRAAYRTKLIVDKCHIEGTGSRLSKAYFHEGAAVTSQMMEDFNNRADKDHIDEFVGILYAKPVTRFGGTVAEQYSYVDLDITSSRIIDNTYLPWSMFSFYNRGNATVSDGHHRSHLYLNNNTYAYGPNYPLCYFTAKKDGIVHSPFLLSEFPEVECSGSDFLTEKQAVQNVPVVSRDSNEWASFFSADKPRGNHRFLSNRTLALKFPYFQNIENVDLNTVVEGATIDTTKAPNTSAVIYYSSRPNYRSPFISYDDDARSFVITHTPTGEQTSYEEQPRVLIFLDDDLISCKRGDVLDAALVTDSILCNCTYEEKNDDNGAKSYDMVSREEVIHNIRFVELNSAGDILGSYSYETPYMTGEINSDDWYNSIFPATAACKHVVCNKDTTHIKIAVDFAVPKKKVPNDEMSRQTISRLYAVLVEKNK